MPFFISPIGNSQIIDANGNPLNGGFLETYLAGTSTPRTTYTTQAGNVAQGAVMTLGSLGYPENGAVWMQGGIALKFIVKNAAGVVQSTFDNISGIGDADASPSEWVLFDAAPTYVSATSFTLVGDQTNTFQVNRKLKSVNTGGTVYSQIVSAVFAATITTVTVSNSVGVLDVGLSAVSYGLLAPNNSSIPEGAVGALVRLSKTQAEAKTALGVADSPSVRQTVLSGPVDANGQAAFGSVGIGTATLIATGTLDVTCFAGGENNRRGQVTDMTFTSPAGTGFGLLFAQISSDGVVTGVVRNDVQDVVFGNAASVVAGKITIGVNEGIVRLGNGVTANQVYELAIGECTYSAGVWAGTPIWYALRGKYVSPFSACASTASITNFEHNIGMLNISTDLYLRCNVSQAGMAVGDIFNNPLGISGAAYSPFQVRQITRNTARYITADSFAYAIFNAGTGTAASVTSANFSQRLIAERGW